MDSLTSLPSAAGAVCARDGDDAAPGGGAALDARTPAARGAAAAAGAVGDEPSLPRRRAPRHARPALRAALLLRRSVTSVFHLRLRTYENSGHVKSPRCCKLLVSMSVFTSKTNSETLFWRGHDKTKADPRFDQEPAPLKHQFQRCASKNIFFSLVGVFPLICGWLLLVRFFN